MENHTQATLYYDSDCRFCTGCAQFVSRHDTHKRIQLIALEASEHKREDKCYESILLIQDDKQLQFSTAVIEVLKTMGGTWKVFAWLLWCIPKPVRDWGYRFIGARRYWFGGNRPNC